MTDTSELCGVKTRRGYNQTTAFGKPFWATDPHPEDVRIEDIAAQLSRICRFGGALKDYFPHPAPLRSVGIIETYSVAQHSVLVSDHVPEPFRLRALLHDAAEAYVGDVIKPVKMAMTLNYEHLYMTLHDRLGYRVAEAAYELLRTWLPDFGRLEAAVQRAVLSRFGLPISDDEADAAISIADYRAVLTEHRDLQEPSPEVDWGEPKHPPFEERIIPLLPSAARALFLQRFNELYKGE